MDTLVNVTELILSASAGALGALAAGVVLVTLRVTFSARRRRQFFRVREQSRNLWFTIRRVLFEAPESGDDTNPVRVQVG